MRRRNLIQALGKAHDICTAQRLAAEMHAARAAQALDQLGERRTEALETLAQETQSWRRTVAGPSLDLQLAAAWSHTVLEGQQALVRLDGEIREAEDQKARLAEAWRIADARTDAVEDLRRTARAEFRRKRDEAALAEVADRAALRSARP